MLFFNYLTITNDNFYLFYISSFVFILSFTLMYLDDFKFSNIKLIKYIQIFSFVCIPFYMLYNLYDLFNFCFSDIVSYATDNKDNKDINLHGHVSVNTEAGKAIGQGLQTIGSQIGLGATITGVATVVGKAVAKSGMPPLQKAGLILSSGLAAGLGQTALNAINRRSIYEDNTNIITSVSNTESNITSVSNTESNIKNFINDSNTSPLQDLFFNGEMMSYVCLSITYILIMQLVFKLYFKDSIKINLINLLSKNINIKLEYYLNKLIRLNKQMSIVWIWFGFVTVMFGLSISVYAIHDILINLDSYVNIHVKLNSNINENINLINMFSKSMKDNILNLKISNYISIIAIISLMGLTMLKFHFNKNVHNIFIWLLILILIITLAFSAYTYNELYTNINSYVNMYLNQK